MHQFGVPRFGYGVWDDYFEYRGRHNSRILGDFRKSIKVSAVVDKMAQKLATNPNWKVEGKFHREDSEQASMTTKQLRKLALTSFRRSRLQCRLFELGNNVYLGMELPREFQAFKSVMNNMLLNRLWYEAAFEVISNSHAIRRRERRRIPQFFLEDHSITKSLKDLRPLDGFRFGSEFTFRLVSLSSNGSAIIEPADAPRKKDTIIISSEIRVVQRQETSPCALSFLRVGDLFEIVDYFEIVDSRGHEITVRSSTGHISKLQKSLRVHISSDLARSPSGYDESKVALASFDLAHYVSHRTFHLAWSGDDKEEFITTLIGDAQASPHFMRYSGLSGACINCATFNNMLGQSLSNVPFGERISRYAYETNWSNREVVRRGTGSDFGFDGFLRPGFNYDELVHYLFDKSLEARDLGLPVEPLLSREWQSLIAAALVPRGMETEDVFFLAAVNKMKKALESKMYNMLGSVFQNQSETFLRGVSSYYVSKLASKWTTKRAGVHSQVVLSQLTIDERKRAKQVVAELTPVAETLISCLNQAVVAKLLNRRNLAEVFHQPKALDAQEYVDYQYLIDSYGRKLGLWVCFAAIAAHLSSHDKETLTWMVLKFCLAVLILSDPFRIRNRVFYAHSRFATELVDLRKAVFSLADGKESASPEQNPYIVAVKHSVAKFYDTCALYGENDTGFMDDAFKRFEDSKTDEQSIVAFMKQIASDFMVNRCNGNTHIHDELVTVYFELDDLLQARRQRQKLDLSQEAGYIAACLDGISDVFESKYFLGPRRLRGQLLLRNMLRCLRKLPQKASSERLRRAVGHLEQMHVALKHRTVAG